MSPMARPVPRRSRHLRAGRFYNPPDNSETPLHSPIPSLTAPAPETALPMAAEMEQVDSIIRTRLVSDVALVNQISAYIIGAGGKRIRPRLVLLFAGALGFEGPERLELAAIVEFIHTATLLHDDVVDESACGAAAKPRTPCSAMRRACWSATFCIRVPSR